MQGDFNADGSVDQGDYLVWRRNPSALGGSTGYDLWRSNFGATSSSGSGSSLSHTAVPEPSAIFLALICGLGITAGNGRRRKES